MGITVGFGVSNRMLQRAADRNKIKRLMREQFRIVCSDTSYTPIEGNGFFIYNSRELPSLETIEKAMLPLVKRWVDLQ